MTRINDIIGLASRLSGFDAADIKGVRRFQALTRVRMAVYYVARQHGHSFPKIAAILNRDHSTVVYGNSQCANIMSRDPEYAAFVTRLQGGALIAKPFDYERRERVKVVYEFAEVAPVKPNKPRASVALPRNTFTAKLADQDGGHRFHESMKAGSTALLAALNREALA